MTRSDGSSGSIDTCPAPTATRCWPSAATSPLATSPRPELAESETRFRDLADKSTDILWHFVGRAGPHFDYVSPSVENILGYSPSYLIDDFDRFLGILDDEDRALIDRAFSGEPMPDRCDFHYRHANGSIVIGEVQFTEVPGGLQGVVRDVTELRRLQESLDGPRASRPADRFGQPSAVQGAARSRPGPHTARRAATRRRLPRPRRLQDRQRLLRSRRRRRVLCETADRLLSVVRGADVVARLGGDEFVIVYEPNDPSADKLVERIDAAISAPVYVNASNVVRCLASIGVADTATSDTTAPRSSPPPTRRCTR